jgi:DNA-binding MarR family transcriptional regulator
MHKTRVSRAVASLEERKLIARAANSADGRELRLHLTKSGRRIYQALVPLALQRERELLSCFGVEQRRAFLTALMRLEKSLKIQSEE